MRDVSSTLRQILLSDTVEMIYLVKIDHPVSKILDTTAATKITYDGNEYTPNGNLLSIEAPRLSDAVDKEPYKIVYADAELEKFSRLEGSWVGMMVTVYAVFYNTLGVTVGSVVPGQPLLNDVVIAYKGRVDSQGYTINPDDGKVLAVLDCASPMAALGLIRSFYTSKDSMKLKAPSDTSFDEVYIGTKEAAILWGRA